MLYNVALSSPHTCRGGEMMIWVFWFRLFVSSVIINIYPLPPVSPPFVSIYIILMTNINWFLIFSNLTLSPPDRSAVHSLVQTIDWAFSAWLLFWSDLSLIIGGREAATPGEKGRNITGRNFLKPCKNYGQYSKLIYPVRVNSILPSSLTYPEQGYFSIWFVKTDQTYRVRSANKASVLRKVFVPSLCNCNQA